MTLFTNLGRGGSSARRLAIAGMAVAVALTVSSCAATPEPEETGPVEMTDVLLGIPAIQASSAPLYLGIENGTFEKYGINLEITVLPQGGPAVVPAVLAGEVQFGATTNTSVILAHSAEIPIKAIAPAESGGTDPDRDVGQVTVLADSGISEVADLEGRTIAIISLKGIQELQVSSILDDAGVDPKSVQFVPLPLPQMAQALKDGQVDAVAITEPFLTDLESTADIEFLAANSVSVMDNMPGATFIASDDLIDTDPGLVRRFQLAVQEAHGYAQEHTDEVRATLKEITEIAPELIDEMRIPTYVTEFNVPGIQKMIDLAVKYGFIPEGFDAEDILAPLPLPEG